MLSLPGKTDNAEIQRTHPIFPKGQDKVHPIGPTYHKDEVKESNKKVGKFYLVVRQKITS